MWGKEQNTNYYYKLTTAFKVVPDVVYGSQPMMKKAANTAGDTWRANLCHLAPSRSSSVLSVGKSFPSQWLLHNYPVLHVSEWHFHVFLLHRTALVMYECCSTWQTSISKQVHQDNDVGMWNSCAPLYTYTYWL